MSIQLRGMAQGHVQKTVPDVDPDYCPECGRAWHTTDEQVRVTPAARDGWVWLLVTVGIYLTLSVSPRIWESLQSPGWSDRLATAQCLAAGTEQDWATCDVAQVRATGALGLACVVLGVVAATRPAAERRHNGPGSKRGSAGAGVRGLARGAGLQVVRLIDLIGRSFVLLLIVLVLYIGTTRILAGVQVSPYLLASSLDRAVGLILLVLQIAA